MALQIWRQYSTKTAQLIFRGFFYNYYRWLSDDINLLLFSVQQGGILKYEHVKFRGI